MGLYDDVYASFAAAGVRFVVVGGMAVVMSGHVRATVDLDVVVDLEPEAAGRAIDALTGLGLQPRVPVAPRDFADPVARASWIADKHMQVLSFFDPSHVAREVDVFVAYPLDFEELVAAAVPTAIGGGLTVPVASKEHLLIVQADAVAKLSAEQRLQLLQELLDIAEASGALQQMRQDKQRAIDALWSSTG